MQNTFKILFVDDEQNVIDGLRRSFRGMSHEWEIAFAVSARDALVLLDSAPFDVIVSDMRMPLMDGPELLSEVSERYPQIVRFALSGHSDEEMILRSVKPAHQYISKPCNVDELKSIVLRACALKRLLSSDALQQLASQTESIPSLPSLYLEICKEIESANGSMMNVGETISKDMGMSAKILQIANSAFFGLRQRISDPAQAAMFLGMSTIKALVSSIRVFVQIDPKILSQFRLEGLWRHSLTSADYAKAIAGMENAGHESIEDCFTSGLLHDVGILLLASKHPERYLMVHNLIENKKMSRTEAEMDIFGGTHAELGGYLLGIWGLNDSIVEAACFHHVPVDSPGNKFTPLTAVHVANALEHNIDQREESDKVSQIDYGYLTSIDMIDRLPEWVEGCRNLNRRRRQ